MKKRSVVYNQTITFKLTKSQKIKLDYIFAHQENTQTGFLRQACIDMIDGFEKKHGIINTNQTSFDTSAK